jgi:DMSO/TMAO reductase YedYZ heme-binding membrane subunit/nitrite reductase/ring-hydroxylating ferredoxin subunit
MSVGFRAVQWNRTKLVYDAVLVVAVLLVIAGFAKLYWSWYPPKDLPAAIDIWIRTFGTCAFLMLTVILMIGPLARLNPVFLPLLYNRRHFGVLTFLIAAIHFCFLLAWYLVQHNLPDLLNELTTWGDYAKFIDFPFKALGIIALVVLFLMAATSHDFWLLFLTPRSWKSLHMLVYVAYGLVIAHVSLGTMQGDTSRLVPVMLASSLVCVAALHLITGWRERALDRGSATNAEGWIAVGPPRSIPDKGARIVAPPGGERIAIFRDGAQIGALTNLCAHQNGPLGEGRIIDGCVTCPWHGYQYRLADGCAPPPFTEKLVTYRVRIKNSMVEVDPRPLPPGTPAAIECPIDVV